ncbi:MULTISPECIES: SH3 domain-containing protein [Sphingobacterium]|uniref:SH3 domain-containing protein n=1 Tax=Sphingobacterium populi TaxID=1812824 RepID=A0ABW5UCN0_9SPHI|nr:SH3 domain-containing protein [Sphingobacterium sp. CFCC 11742]
MKKIQILILFSFSFVSFSFANHYRVTSERISIYHKPSISGELGYLTKGYVIKHLEKYDDNWSYVSEDIVQGYISNNGIEEIQPTEGQQPQYSSFILIALSIACAVWILRLLYASDQGKEIQNHNDYIVENNTRFIYKSKSITIAIILTTLFGPFGMLYSTLRGAITMILLPIILIIATVFAFGFDNAFLKIVLASSSIIFFILYWFICVIWGAVAASNSIKIKRM